MQNGLPEFAGDGEHQVEIVDGEQLVSQDLLGFDQVADVGPAEMGASVAIASGVDGRGIFSERGVAHDEPPCARHSRAGAGHSRGQDAIEHIHAPRHAFDQILRRADAHQIAGLIGRQDRVDHVEHGVHVRFALADAQAADGIPVETQLGQIAGRLLAQVGVDSALDDAEECLTSARLGGLAPLGPGVGAGQGGDVVRVVVRIGALVEADDDVGPQVLLDGDGFFRRETMGRTVQVGAEGDAVGVDLASLGEAEDLETAGIGEDGAVPGHESVQAAQGGDQFVAGAKVEVIGIGQDDRGLHRVQGAGRDRLDGGLGANRHEDRRRYVAVRGVVHAGAGGPVGCLEVEIKKRAGVWHRVYRVLASCSD